MYGRPEKLTIMQPNTKTKMFKENDSFTSNTLYLTLSSNSYMKVYVTYKANRRMNFLQKKVNLNMTNRFQIGKITFDNRKFDDEDCYRQENLKNYVNRVANYRENE